MTEYKIKLDIFKLLKERGYQISSQCFFDMQPVLVLTLDSEDSKTILNIDYIENS